MTCATVAITTNTPVTEVWTKFSIGQLIRYLSNLEHLLPFFNPLAGGGKKNDDVSDALLKLSPRKRALALRAMGVGVKNG